MHFIFICIKLLISEQRNDSIPWNVFTIEQCKMEYRYYLWTNPSAKRPVLTDDWRGVNQKRCGSETTRGFPLLPIFIISIFQKIVQTASVRTSALQILNFLLNWFVVQISLRFTLKKLRNCCTPILNFFKGFFNRFVLFNFH